MLATVDSCPMAVDAQARQGLFEIAGRGYAGIVTVLALLVSCGLRCAGNE